MVSVITLDKDAELLEEITYGTVNEGFEHPNLDITVVSNEQLGSGRWTSHHMVVWHESGPNGGELYGYEYERGLTEYQDGDDAYYPEAIFEVEAEEVTVTNYKKKP